MTIINRRTNLRVIEDPKNNENDNNEVIMIKHVRISIGVCSGKMDTKLPASGKNISRRRY